MSGCVGVTVAVNGWGRFLMIFLKLVPKLLDEIHDDDLAGVVPHGAQQEDTVVTQVHVDKLLEEVALAPGVAVSQDHQILLDKVFPALAVEPKESWMSYRGKITQQTSAQGNREIDKLGILEFIIFTAIHSSSVSRELNYLLGVHEFHFGSIRLFLTG